MTTNQTTIQQLTEEHDRIAAIINSRYDAEQAARREALEASASGDAIGVARTYAAYAAIVALRKEAEAQEFVILGKLDAARRAV